MPDTHIDAALFLAFAAAGMGCSEGSYETYVGAGGSHGVGPGGAGGADSVTAGGGGAKDGGGGAGGSAASGGSGGAGGGGGAGGTGGAGGGAVDACPDTALWLKRYGDPSDQTGLSVAADAQGNVVIAGVFQGSIDFGDGPLTAAGGGAGVYVAKLAPDGAALWSHAYPGGIDFLQGGASPFATVAVAPSGDVLLGGVFAGTVDFGAGPVTASSSIGDGFVVAFDPAGHALWSAHYGDPPPAPSAPAAAAQAIESLAIDPAGDTIALGYRAAGLWGALFLVKLDPQGQPLWTKDVSASGTLEATVRADASGDVLVAGLAYEPVDFGDGPIPTSTALPTLFSAKLDPAGDPLWSQGVITSGFALHPGNGLGVDPAGNVFIAGAGPSFGFDAGCGTASDAWEVKLLQLDAASGACRWMWGILGTGAALAVDASGRAILATDAGDTLATCPDSGAGLPGSTCDQAYTQPGGATAVQGLAAAPGGRVLVTGAFTGSVAFPGSAGVTSAGGRDVFLASF